MPPAALGNGSEAGTAAETARGRPNTCSYPGFEVLRANRHCSSRTDTHAHVATRPTQHGIRTGAHAACSQWTGGTRVNCMATSYGSGLWRERGSLCPLLASLARTGQARH